MIGKKIRDLLAITNRKQIELAKYLNISASRLSNYLSDKREPDLEMLAEIAVFFGVDLNYFSGRDFVTDEDLISNKVTYEDDDSLVTIPTTQLCSKKKTVNKNKLSIPKILLKGIKKPEENVSIFSVTSETIPPYIKKGDFVVAIKSLAVPLQNGDIILDRGRNAKIYKYYRDEAGIYLIDVNDDKNCVRVKSAQEIETFYKILWVFNNYSYKY